MADEDETTLIRLLTSTPSRDLKGLMEGLKADRAKLLKRLEKVIDGEENKFYYAALRTIVFGTLDPAEAHAKMASARILPWSDPGLIKAIWTPRVKYETVEYTSEGKVRVVFWVNLAMFGMQAQEQIFEPDEIMGLNFKLDEDFAGAVEGETLFMPAANLIAFENEQFSRELGIVVDVGLLFAGGVGLIAKGSRLAKAIAILDTAMAAADLRSTRSAPRSPRPRPARTSSAPGTRSTP